MSVLMTQLPECGLVVRVPWIDLILDDKKPWEIRGSNTTKRGTIALIQSGTGLVMGTAFLTGTRPLSLEEYRDSERFHRVPNTKTSPAPYRKIWVWELSNPKRYSEPVPYHHPPGAVIWVKLHSRTT